MNLFAKPFWVADNVKSESFHAQESFHKGHACVTIESQSIFTFLLFYHSYHSFVHCNSNDLNEINNQPR